MKLVQVLAQSHCMHNPHITPYPLLAAGLFVAASRLVGVFGDRYARVLALRRRKK